MQKIYESMRIYAVCSHTYAKNLHYTSENLTLTAKTYVK